MVSGEQQRDSAVHTHVSIPPKLPSHPGCHVTHNTEQSSICYAVGPCWLSTWNMCCAVLRPVWLFVTPWTVARQAPLSMGILQARILEWVAIPFFRGSWCLRDWTLVSCIAGRHLRGEKSRTDLILFGISLALFQRRLLRFAGQSGGQGGGFGDFLPSSVWMTKLLGTPGVEIGAWALALRACSCLQIHLNKAPRLPWFDPHTPRWCSLLMGSFLLPHSASSHRLWDRMPQDPDFSL